MAILALLLAACLAAPALGADATAFHGWEAKTISVEFDTSCPCGQGRIALGGRGGQGVRILDLDSLRTVQLTTRNLHKVLQCTQDGRVIVFYDAATSLATPYYARDLSTGKTAKLYMYPGIPYRDIITPTQEYLIGQPNSEEYRDILTSIRRPLGHTPADVYSWDSTGTVLYSIATTAGTTRLQRESLREGTRESFALTDIEPEYAVMDIWPIDANTLLADAELTSTAENDPRPDKLNYTFTLTESGIRVELTGHDIWRVVSGNGRIFHMVGARQGDTVTDVYAKENGQDVLIAHLPFPVTPTVKTSPDGNTILLIERAAGVPSHRLLVVLQRTRP